MKCLLPAVVAIGFFSGANCFADSEPTATVETPVSQNKLAPEDVERESSLDPYAQIHPASKPVAAPVQSEKSQVKGLFKDLEKLGSDVGQAGIKTIEGTKHLVGGADDLVKATDAVVKGAEVAPKKIVDGVEAAPKAVVNGTKSLVNDVAFPADANTMDYDGDL